MEKVLKFLQKESKKIQGVLEKESGNNYKKYATLAQLYLTYNAQANQLEAIIKQQKEEEKRRKESEKAYKEGMTEIKKEQKSKNK